MPPSFPQKTARDLLAQSLTLPCGLLLPNRLVKCPMQETLAVEPFYDPPIHKFKDLYTQWANASYGLLRPLNNRPSPNRHPIPLHKRRHCLPLPIAIRTALQQMGRMGAYRAGGRHAVYRAAGTPRADEPRGRGRAPEGDDADLSEQCAGEVGGVVVG
ncbi:hypothetical protein MMC30_000083 [Trapelia coarctata]|nr:hypothetical protein [Trapelia coarctata]